MGELTSLIKTEQLPQNNSDYVTETEKVPDSVIRLWEEKQRFNFKYEQRRNT